MTELVFCKLGGSVLTVKSRPRTARARVIGRLACEVRQALDARPGLELVLGHGSGSFGHAMAKRTGTQDGIRGREGWKGFVQVAAEAARLNRRVTDALLASGVPAWSLAPSASARCEARRLMSLNVEPVRTALEAGLVPVVYGDVALDQVLGGTIVSTEQVLAYLARELRPGRLLLVCDVDGVYSCDQPGHPAAGPLHEINAANWGTVQRLLGGSRAGDVTGGMRSKVEEMVRLARDLPGLEIRILSARHPGDLMRALTADRLESGTAIRWP